MRILLISPNTLREPYPVYPLGLDYVAGSVAARHQVRIADLNTMDLADLARLVAEFSPTLIGISCRNIDNTEAATSRSFIREYQQLVSWLRARSRALVVCGGAGFTIMPRAILAAVGADLGLVGEGERFGLLADALDQEQDPCLIPGVITPDSPAAPPLPPPWTGPQRRDFRDDAAHKRFYLEHGGMLSLQSKRGCSFRCIYCPYPRIEGRQHRLIDPEEVARMALKLEAAGASYFFITDSAFNSDVPHSLAVARAFTAAGVSIPWGAFFAPVKLPPEYFSTMAEAGLRHVEFGTEALADPMLESYRKPFRVREVFTAHRQALEAGLHTAHYLLLGGPGESRATVSATLEQMERLTRTVLFCFIGIRVYPGTGLYRIALEQGRIGPDTDLLKPVFYQAEGIDQAGIEAMVRERAGQRINWVVGSGGSGGADTVRKLHQRGYSGPLWEFLIR
ncbi:lipid biosynthesis B12-binding/radical SAM protein [Desulfogranum mediterraneum]|uniref:lipid biosynthesis B12-binding/radical SAM protein n=1 Tax=Desulfogranum mediterraneum TaxID=160661 RepID=UPI00041A0F95|nr:lipid biosynthesis B12-binding/radical SAM protein [Desulfogranum mediterraneum]